MGYFETGFFTGQMSRIASRNGSQKILYLAAIVMPFSRRRPLAKNASIYLVGNGNS
jgi:hypothetical protein